MMTLEEVRNFLEGLSADEVETIKKSIGFNPAKDVFGPELIYEIVKPRLLGPSWLKSADGSWLLPEHTLGWEIAGWATRFLLDPRDPTKPWKFTLEQLRFVLWWYAIDGNGNFLHRTGVLQRMKGWGKDPLLAVLCLVEFVGPCRFSHWRSDGTPAGRPETASLVQVAAVTADQPLALDTPVSTTRGETTIGDLHVGDCVFDESGHPRKVARETEVLEGLDCYRVTFDDGTEVVASASHSWSVELKSRKGSSFSRKTLTTEQMLGEYVDARNHSRIKIPLTARLGEAIELPIDPYIMGYWLGDGSTWASQFCADMRDRDELIDIFRDRISEDQIVTHSDKVDPGNGAKWSVISVKNLDRLPSRQKSIRQHLREMGLTEGKFFPEEYLRGSFEQRLEMLQGMIDSDGMVQPTGDVRFTNVNKSLVDGFVNLARSLGQKCKVTPRKGNVAYDVNFRPNGIVVSKLSRKLKNQTKKLMQPYRYIRLIEKIESVPVKCIGIDTESHLFQVAGGIITHNTKNTSDMFPLLMSSDLKLTYGIKGSAASEVIRANQGRQKIQLVSSNWRALEGKRTTFSLLNEALDIDTLIPTPDGMRRLGDIEDGDVIYGSNGRPTIVVKAHEIQHERRCFEVSLSNGAKVIASDGHLWDTGVANSAAKRKVRTTLEMFEDGRRFTLPRAGVQTSSDVPLPVDPYLLGYWLGDGSTGDCNITIGNQDVDEAVAELGKRGVPLHRVGNSGTPRFSFSVKRGFGADMGGELAVAFRSLPCYRSKHVPANYHAAGTRQRLELLRGLMDSDGCYSSQGMCIFVGNKQLAQDVFDLASSLGFLPGMKFAPDSRSRDGGSWRVSFLPEGLNPFSLPRKADRVAIRPRRRTVAISSVKEVATRPVRCLTVSAADSLFQAGQGVVTHNTHHWVDNDGQRMAEVIYDNITKIEGGRWLAITNAFMPGEGSVAEGTRADHEKALTDAQTDDWREAYPPGEVLLYDSVEAHPRAPLGGPLAPLVLRGMMGDAYWLESQIGAIIASARRRSISMARSRRMWLNQVLADDDALVTRDEWADCLDENLVLMPGDEVTLGFDGGKSDDATCLVAVRIRDKAVFLLGCWENVNDEPGWYVDQAEVSEQVYRAAKMYQVRAFYADVSLWESYITDWTNDLADSFAVKASERSPIGFDMRGNQARLTMAHERMLNAILTSKLKHDGDLKLREHVLNARRNENRWGVSFKKESRESSKKVDAYAAMMLAYEAMYDVQTRGKEVKRQRTGRGYFF